MRESTVEKVDPIPAFGAPYVLTLSVVDGPDPTQIHRIVDPRTTVGRADGADFILADTQVSKAHFGVEVVGGIYTLIDLGSRNGTSLNGRPVSAQTRVRIKHGDEIVVGRTRLLFAAVRFRD